MLATGAGCFPRFLTPDTKLQQKGHYCGGTNYFLLSYRVAFPKAKISGSHTRCDECGSKREVV